MIYDAFAHLPIYARGPGFCGRAAAAFIRERNTCSGRGLPLNTNGAASPTCTRDTACMPSRRRSGRLRGIARPRFPGKSPVSHGVGGMFGAPGTVILTNEG